MKSKEKELANIQTCLEGHKYYANSHEYPCPLCRLEHSRGALADIRMLVTSCQKRDVAGELKRTCEFILTRSTAKGIEYTVPSWFVHEWERDIYEKQSQVKACK